MKIKFSILSLALFLACSSPKDSNTVENSALKKVTQESVPKNITTFFNKIIGNQEGVFRGYDFGDGLCKIQESEVLEQFEDVEANIGYTFNSPSMETVDILYFRDEEDRLKSISIDIYLNSEEESKQMLQAFTNYFTSRYGEPTVQIGLPTWETDDVTAKIKMIRTKLDTGLQIQLEP